MIISALLMDSLRKFQSAPGLMAGRCDLPLPDSPTRARFQSAPGLMAGRCHAGAQQGLGGLVSIRARPDGRAMALVLIWPRVSVRFQSAPGLMAGR